MRPMLSPRMLGMRLDAAATIELAGRHGFLGVELLVRDLVDGGADLGRLAGLMAARGLRGGTWPLPVSWRGDPDRFRDDLRRLPSHARAALALGLDRTGTWILPEILDPALLCREDPDRAAFDWHVERLDAVARILADHGQCLGLEAIGVPASRNDRGRPFINRLEALDPLLDALADRGRPVGLTVDAFHLHAAGERIETALRRGINAIVSVHLSDVPEGDPPDPTTLRDDRRALPRASGVVACAGLLRLLGGAGYTGPVFAEPMPGGVGPQSEVLMPDDHDAIARRAARALAAIWPAGGRAGTA